jgi:hypothetical protein
MAKRFLFPIFLSLLISLPVLADSMPVPAKIQAAIFLKVICYDKNMKNKSGNNIKIGVFYSNSPNSIKARDDFEASVNSVSGKKVGDFNFSAVGIEISQINSIKSKGIKVLYITPENKTNLETIKKIARENGLMTITGVPEYVESGISVGLEAKGDSSRIIINLNSAKLEGIEFSAQLLKLARIIK